VLRGVGIQPEERLSDFMRRHHLLNGTTRSGGFEALHHVGELVRVKLLILERVLVTLRLNDEFDVRHVLTGFRIAVEELAGFLLQQLRERRLKPVAFAPHLLLVVVLLNVSHISVDVAREPDTVERRRERRQNVFNLLLDVVDVIRDLAVNFLHVHLIVDDVRRFRRRRVEPIEELPGFVFVRRIHLRYPVAVSNGLHRLRGVRELLSEFLRAI